MKFEIIEDKEQLYDKCENMEQLYDNYYYNLLVNYQELKKQLEEYKRLGFKHLNDKCNELEKQLEEKSKIGMADHKYASKCEDKVITMEYQQEEFIEYLEYQVKLQEELNDKLLATGFEEILSKYKQIIGVSNENNT